MKICCKRSDLLNSVSGVSRAVSSKSVIPSIEGILFKARGDIVSLTAYDLEIGIVTEIPAGVESEGEVVINAKLLLDMIRKVEGEDILLESDEKLHVSFRCGITKFDFTGISAADFPELPAPDTETALSLPGSELKEMIDRTIFAVAQDNQKPVHTGTKFFIDPEMLTLVAVDGYRLAVCKKPIVSAGEQSFVVPAKTLFEVSRLIGSSEDEISVGTARRYAVFSLKGYTVITRLLEGDFLDYKRAIPDGWKSRVKIGVGELYDSVERASLIITDRFRSPVKLRFEGDSVSISCVTALGKSYDELEASMTGEAVEIGFNNRYILDALKNCGVDIVYLEINEATSPMKIVPAEGDDFLFLVLPVRIRSE